MSWWSDICSFPKRYLEDKHRIVELRREVKRVHNAVDKAASEALASGDEVEAQRLTASKSLETALDEDETLAHEDFILMRTAGLLLVYIPNSELSHDTHPAFTMLTGEGRSRVLIAVRLRIIVILIFIVPLLYGATIRGLPLLERLVHWSIIGLLNHMS
jgi:hypothetical protein